MPRPVEDPKVLIVPVGDGSFERAMNRNEYSRPRLRRLWQVKYIAFYRVSPISAVTHLSEIVEVTLTPSREASQLFKITQPQLLPRAILKGDRGPVQGSKYTTMAKLKTAKTLSDL